MRSSRIVIDLMRSANPVRADELSGAVEEDSARELLDRVLATTVPIHPRPRRTNRRYIPAIAAIVALAVALVIVMVDRDTAVRETAPVTLEDLATLAANRAAPSEDGRFRYVRSENAYLSTNVERDGAYTVLVPKVREIWVASDGSGRLREVAEEPVFLGPRDREKWERAGRPEMVTGESDDRFGKNGLFYEDFEGLPREVEDLYEEIENRARGSGPGLHPEMFVLCGDLLRETVAPPDLRAALFRVLGRIPGVEVVEDVADEHGRRGIAAVIEYDNSGTVRRRELIFDPETTELLGERDTLLNRVDWVDADPGTTIGYSVYEEWGFVDSVRERP
jgi:hypothetical protein